jgi:prepilin-type N-terminal cleavage/methylation domain-containing protein
MVRPLHLNQSREPRCSAFSLEESDVSDRRGFTLIETLVALVVVSLGMLIAIPHVRDAFAQNTLLNTRAKVVSLYSTARAISSSSGRVTYLHLDNNRVMVTAVPRRKTPIGANTRDTIGVPENVSTLYGVSITTNVDSVKLDRNGLGAAGVATTVKFTKGSHVDSLVISPYGRVLK